MRSLKLLVSTVVALTVAYCPVASAKFFWEKEEVKHSTSYVAAAYGTYSPDSEDFDDGDRYLELGIGAKMSEHFGVEAVYSDIGKVSNYTANAELTGVSALVVGYYQISSYADAYLKGGIFFSKVNLTSGSYDESFKDEQPTLGAGVNITVSDNVTVFAEYSRLAMEIDDSKVPSFLTDGELAVNTMKVGLRLLF